MPKPRIVDTNVPLVAAGKHEHATVSCRRSCVDFVNSVLNGDVCLVLDEHREVLSEYRSNMYPDPNPSSGLANNFLMYIISNYGIRERVQRLILSWSEDGEYNTWPRDLELLKFDPSDRKWVALAVAFEQETGQKVPITYAIDRDWDDNQEALKRCGIKLNPLCPKPSVVNSKRQ